MKLDGVPIGAVDWRKIATVGHAGETGSAFVLKARDSALSLTLMSSANIGCPERARCVSARGSRAALPRNRG